MTAEPGAALSQLQFLGKLEEFDPTADTVAAYVERAQLFFVVNNIPAEKKVPVLLNAIGKANYQLLRNLLAPIPPAEKSFEDLVTALKGHFEPKPLVISERFAFHRRQQGQHETVLQYVAELRKLTLHCEFGAYLEEALRDRFVCGLKSEAVQKKLHTKSELTFQEAIQTALSSEQAVEKARQLQSQASAAPLMNVGKVSINQGGANSCYRCGRPDHQPTQCKFKTARCH